MDSESAIVLIAMHPKYVDLIARGEKKIEFRKKTFSKPVKLIVIYATSPAKKIVGFFDVKEIEKSSPQNLWNYYSSIGGINKTEFFNYYKDAKNAIGIHIKNYYPLTEPKDPLVIGISIPQSYIYLSEKQFRIIYKS